MHQCVRKLVVRLFIRDTSKRERARPVRAFWERNRRAFCRVVPTNASIHAPVLSIIPLNLAHQNVLLTLMHLLEMNEKTNSGLKRILYRLAVTVQHHD